jgi:hypothetical protein
MASLDLVYIVFGPLCLFFLVGLHKKHLRGRSNHHISDISSPYHSKQQMHVTTNKPYQVYMNFEVKSPPLATSSPSVRFDIQIIFGGGVYALASLLTQKIPR